MLLLFSDNRDTLICGNCKEMFHNLSDIIDHKKHYCKLRFTCKCAPKITNTDNTDGRDSGIDIALECDGGEMFVTKMEQKKTKTESKFSPRSRAKELFKFIKLSKPFKLCRTCPILSSTSKNTLWQNQFIFNYCMSKNRPQPSPLI